MNETRTGPDVVRRRIAANLKAARERAGLAQPVVADLMRKEEFPYSQQAVARNEAAARKADGAELEALARIYRVAVTDFLRPEGLALQAWDIISAARRAREAHRAMTLEQRSLSAARGDLERLLRRAEDKGNAGELAPEIALARRALAGTAAGR